MEVLRFVDGHWTDLLVGLSVLAGWLGLKEKARRKQATWDLVEKWANAAADGVILFIQTQYHETDHIDETRIVNMWRERLLEFATAIGFDVSEDHMKRAMAIANARLGKVALAHNLSYVAKAAEAIRRKMNNGLVPPITKNERAVKASNPPPLGEEKKP